MSFDRLTAIQETLTDLYEQLAGQEKAWRLAEDAEKTRLKQKIREKWQEIREYEGKYTQTLAQQVKHQELPEAVAQTITVELVDELEVLAPLAQRDEVKALLQQILAALQKPATPAAAKLKVAIPIIPNLVSYEMEGDTETVVRRLFPTFTKVYQGMKSLGAGDAKPGK